MWHHAHFLLLFGNGLLEKNVTNNTLKYFLCLVLHYHSTPLNESFSSCDNEESMIEQVSITPNDTHFEMFIREKIENFKSANHIYPLISSTMRMSVNAKKDRENSFRSYVRKRNFDSWNWRFSFHVWRWNWRNNQLAINIWQFCFDKLFQEFTTLLEKKFPRTFSLYLFFVSFNECPLRFLSLVSLSNFGWFTS